MYHIYTTLKYSIFRYFKIYPICTSSFIRIIFELDWCIVERVTVHQVIFKLELYKLYKYQNFPDSKYSKI